MRGEPTASTELPGAAVTDGRATAVRAEQLVKIYGSAAAEVPALRGVTLEIQQGERVALLGKSGSGKSTLLNLIGGLDRPTSGSIWAGGEELGRMSSDALALYRLRTIGIVFQSYNLIPSRTAVQNVELPMVFAGIPPAERRDAATRALEAVGLAHRLEHRPDELSGGEQQRVAIARAIVNTPRILLADEPTGNLDSATAAAIMDLLLEYLEARGATLIMVTHDDEMPRRCADRIVRMRDGRVVD